MKNISPADYMLNKFKYYMGEDYSKCFILNNEHLQDKILDNYTRTLVNYLKLKDENFSYVINRNKVDVFYYSTLIRTYESLHFKNEISLKFQLLVEWGGLLSESEKRLLLIAL